MNTDLTGKIAFVTGGGSGIGEATCHALAQAGAAVAVVDLRPGPAQAVAEAITAAGGRALAIEADVTDEEAIRLIELMRPHIQRSAENGGRIVTYQPDEPVRPNQDRTLVYNRAGLPCRRCGTIIRSRGQGDDNRTTYWCPDCQR